MVMSRIVTPPPSGMVGSIPTQPTKLVIKNYIGLSQLNNGKYDTLSYKALQAEKNDRNFGAIESHIKVCEFCTIEYNWIGRKLTKAFTSSKFCSRKCANNRSVWWKDNATNYRTIALQNHLAECIICGFSKIVAIHHIDENKKNNNPINLIPLCPNHHEMVHSKWKHEVIPFIIEWQEKYGALV